MPQRPAIRGSHAVQPYAPRGAPTPADEFELAKGAARCAITGTPPPMVESQTLDDEKVASLTENAAGVFFDGALSGHPATQAPGFRPATDDAYGSKLGSEQELLAELKREIRRLPNGVRGRLSLPVQRNTNRT